MASREACKAKCVADRLCDAYSYTGYKVFFEKAESWMSKAEKAAMDVAVKSFKSGKMNKCMTYRKCLATAQTAAPKEGAWHFYTQYLTERTSMRYTARCGANPSMPTHLSSVAGMKAAGWHFDWQDPTM